MEERRGCLYILVSALLSLSGCAGIQGSGNVVEENREVSGFTGIILSGIGNVIIQVGESESLRIEAEDNLMEYLKTEVRDGTLRIGIQKNVRLKPKQPVRFYVTVIKLNSVVISGSGNMEAPDLEAEEFNATITGSGSARLNALKANSLGMRISGSGKLDISGGQVEKQEITITGSGSCHTDGLRGGLVNVRISGSGSARVWAEELLNVNISGSGSVGYYGSPKVSLSRSGSGTVSSLGDR